MKKLLVAVGLAAASIAAVAPAEAQPYGHHGYYRSSPRYSYHRGARWERGPGWHRGGYRWRHDYRRRYYYHAHGRRYYGWR